MEFSSTKVQQGVTIKATGRMDTITAPSFEEECLRWMEQGDVTLIIDFSGLEYISSAGLRVILGIGKKLKNQGGLLVFGGMSSMVREVFDISGFTSIFPVHDSMEAALAAT
ncbi:STAS domain-containing protein [Desulfonatronum thioautotrophicum]|uniref:STAS domain-containing protein n=1 Tax=Desulfonatronum thioautotrophicum TaxID=617001 RepID=UPI0005EB6B3F|nr:STAS domain-containing protein [Desulfonatronum thioautotrophicum]